MINSTLLVAVVRFVERFSSADLVKLLIYQTVITEKSKGICEKIIVNVICHTASIDKDVIYNGGNDKSLYRSACYYFHRKYDKTYFLENMVHLYGKKPNSVRNGLKNIENILSEPRVNKEFYNILIKIDSKLKEIDAWQKQTELDEAGKTS